MSKIIDKTWFNTPKGTIGLVAYKNDMGEVKFAISPVQGLDQINDAQYVMDWGQKIDTDYIIDFFNRNKQ